MGKWGVGSWRGGRHRRGSVMRLAKRCRAVSDGLKAGRICGFICAPSRLTRLIENETVLDQINPDRYRHPVAGDNASRPAPRPGRRRRAGQAADPPPRVAGHAVCLRAVAGESRQHGHRFRGPCVGNRGRQLPAVQAVGQDSAGGRPHPNPRGHGWRRQSRHGQDVLPGQRRERRAGHRCARHQGDHFLLAQGVAVHRRERG